MTEYQKHLLNDRLLFKAIRGSHAYGTNIETSDTDLVGVYAQPLNDILGFRYMEQINHNKNDEVYYELKRFIELAMKGNPNILELLNTPDDCILHTTPMFEFIRTHKDIFLTKKLRNTFHGYAVSQIKKARGLNKKINWEMQRVERKDVLDFCYVIEEKEKATSFKHWERGNEYYRNNGIPEEYYGENLVNVTRYMIGLAKVNNVKDLYSMYVLEGGGGIIGEDSNDVQLRSIPKDAPFIGYLRFDKNAYSTSCKDYREYQEWLEKRNDARYNTNMEHGKGYDSKNMMHCMRLLNMAEDIALGRGIVVRRPEREELLKIRRGDIDYEELLDKAEEKAANIDKLFLDSDLPEDVNLDEVNNLLVGTRYGIERLSKQFINIKK